MATGSETAADARPEQPVRTRVLGLALPAAHLTVLTSFALAQPLFDLLGKNAEFFAARASPPAEIVLFALAVTFAFPLAVFLVELLGGVIDPVVRTTYGQTGNDTLIGGVGRDDLRGGSSNDTLYAREGYADRVQGERGMTARA